MSQDGRWCEHYRGFQHETCAAGILYADVVTEHGFAKKLAWLNDTPCTTGGKAGARCERLLLPTPEQLADRERQLREFLDAANAAAPGKPCPHCKVTITTVEQVGRCAYMRPCGHRLGQFSLPGGR